MKKSFIIVFLWLLCLGAAAQNISVKSFKALPMDMTASSLEGKRLDQNGEVAALIKVMTTETGFVFEGGTLGIVGTQQRVGEIWVWVPRASRKITILHQLLGGLRDYRYPIEIEAERTYEMVLTTAKIETIVKEEVRMQYLAFQISPPNATLVVDEKYWDVEADGSAQDYVNFGTYSWRVEAPNYYSDAGRVTVDDPNNTKIVTVTLQPNFGWIEVAGTGKLQGASVYVDNALIGHAPCKSEALKSGNHTVRITKKMYATYTETVTVADNETTRLAPTLTADFAEVTLTVDADAEIYVNDERKGTRSWTGPLGSGTYKIECKQANHETSTTTTEITAAMDGQTVTLPAPHPIYGALNVESTPNFCKLYIDDKDMGTTPKSIAEILIGQHEIKLTKDGYADYTETVTITKGDHKQVKVTLNALEETEILQDDFSGNFQSTYGNTEFNLSNAKNQLKRSVVFGINGGIGTAKIDDDYRLPWTIGFDLVFPISSFFNLGLYTSYGNVTSNVSFFHGYVFSIGPMCLIETITKNLWYVGLGVGDYGGDGQIEASLGFEFKNRFYFFAKGLYGPRAILDNKTDSWGILFNFGYHFKFSK